MDRVLNSLGNFAKETSDDDRGKVYTLLENYFITYLINMLRQTSLLQL